MGRRDLELAAVAWALAEVEGQLRQEPAHRLNDRQHEYSWGLTAPSGIGVYVEAARLSTSTAEAVEFDLLASASGWFRRHARDERRLSLSLSGEAARVPALLYLVFETGGHAYAFETLEEAGGSLEALDLTEEHYVGAFSDQGEVMTMRPGDLWIEFSSSGTFNQGALQTLIRSSRAFSEFAEDPHRFALEVWRSS